MTTQRTGIRLKGFSSGQGMVEFALILPVFILLTAGIVEFGRLLAIYSGLSNASREAARWGSAVGSNATGTDYYRDCDGMRAAAQRTSFLLALQDSNVAIGYDTGPSTASIATCPVGTSSLPTSITIQNGDRVVITVTATYSPIMPLLPMLRPFDMTFVAARSVFPNIVIGTPSSSVVTCYTLSVVAGPGGTIPSQPTSTCSGGKFTGNVSFSASANPGYTFTNWTDATSAVVGTANPINYSIGSNSVITANFTPDCHTLTTTATNGSISASPTQNCAGGYTYGTAITLTATGNAGYIFTNWGPGGDVSGTTNPYPSAVSMTANRNVTATFTANATCYLLTRTATNGTITPSITNSTGCASGRYLAGEAFTLTAAGTGLYGFTAWGGAAAAGGTTNPYTFTMPAADSTVSATFGICYTLTKNAIGSGTITTSIPNSTGCASGSYKGSESFTLTATSNPGNNFTGWGDAAAAGGTTNPYNFTMPAANSTVSATFTAVCYTLTLTGSPAVGLSSFTTTAQNCAGGYLYNTNVSVTANPAATYAFGVQTVSKWTSSVILSANERDNPVTIQMQANNSATARFTSPCVKAGTMVIAPGDSKTLRIPFTNYSGITRYITQVDLTWVSNDKLSTASSFGPSALWTGSGAGQTSPFTINSSNWNVAANRGLDDLQTKDLDFTYNSPINDSVTITTYWDDGCAAIVSTGNY